MKLSIDNQFSNKDTNVSSLEQKVELRYRRETALHSGLVMAKNGRL